MTDSDRETTGRGVGAPTLSAREQILGRIASALAARARPPHPGAFGGWRQSRTVSSPEARVETADEIYADDPIGGFAAHFREAGGEVVHVGDEAEARDFVVGLIGDEVSVSRGEGVPDGILTRSHSAPAADAVIGVSFAHGAVAETGSLLMDARDGRGAQLLPPTHIVIVRGNSVYASLSSAFAHVRADLPSALGLHSGPSKSADLGKVMVTGVHGPGRVIAVVVG